MRILKTAGGLLIRYYTICQKTPYILLMVESFTSDNTTENEILRVFALDLCHLPNLDKIQEYLSLLSYAEQHSESPRLIKPRYSKPVPPQSEPALAGGGESHE